MDNYREYIRRSVGKTQSGIEIGPSYSPILPKREGYNVLTIDHATQEELRRKYAATPDTRPLLNNIEPVDAVDDGRDFRELLGREGGFDYIVSSHNFEHITDPVRFLQRAERALNPSGRLFMLVPDRRGTFDYYRPPSTVGQLLEAFLEGRSRHSFAAIYDFWAYQVDGNGSCDTLELLYPPTTAYATARQGAATKDYTDAHAWVYTPSSFLFAITSFQELGLCNLQVLTITPRRENEFFVILAKNGAADAQPSLQELAAGTLAESINPLRTMHKKWAAILPVPQRQWKDSVRYHVDTAFVQAGKPILFRGWALDEEVMRPCLSVMVEFRKQFYPSLIERPRPEIGETYPGMLTTGFLFDSTRLPQPWFPNSGDSVVLHMLSADGMRALSVPYLVE